MCYYQRENGASKQNIKKRKMTRNEQQLYKDISELTKAVQKLVKLLTKIAKEQND